MFGGDSLRLLFDQTMVYTYWDFGEGTGGSDEVKERSLRADRTQAANEANILF